MASALSYVSKFKSFVILFVTPILLLPLIILVPTKVSCIALQPRGLQATGPTNGLRTQATEWERRGSEAGTAPCELRAPDGRCPVTHFKGHPNLGVYGSQDTRTVPTSTEPSRQHRSRHTEHPQAQPGLNLPRSRPSPGSWCLWCLERPGLAFPSFSLLLSP